MASLLDYIVPGRQIVAQAEALARGDSALSQFVSTLAVWLDPDPNEHYHVQVDKDPKSVSGTITRVSGDEA
jgi:hypothetical protein